MNFEKPENQYFEKMKKKIAGDIIVFMCTKSHNYMKYSPWDTELDRIFFVQQKTIVWCMLTQIWSVIDIIFCHFLLFYPNIEPKN